MDSNNNRRRRSSRGNSNNTSPRGGENRRRRREPDNSTNIGKARIIWSNLLDMICKRWPQFVMWIIGFWVAFVCFGFLANATARVGGFLHGLCTVLAVVTKYLGVICIALFIFVLLRKVIRSFNGDGIITPDKKYFKKFHQLKYELFDGVNDEPTTTTATTETPETADILDIEEDDD